MLSVMNLVYVLPVVIALVIAGAVVNARLNGSARTLMWTGIVLTCLTRLAAGFLPYLFLNRGFTQFYAALNLVNTVLSAVGVVLLVVAVGAAARGPRLATGYPPASTGTEWPGQQQPGQPGSFTPQPPGPAQPGQWTNPGEWSGRP